MRIIVDIDGTIADCRHRRHFVIDGNHDWKSFNESMIMDPPIWPVINLVNALEEDDNVDIKFVTGRSEEYREHTKEWLQRYLNNPYNDLHMRATGDSRPDEIVKEEILSLLRNHGWWPHLVLDDRQQVVDMWRRNGIITLQNSMKELPPCTIL